MDSKRILLFFITAFSVFSAPGCSCDEGSQADGYDVSETDAPDSFDMPDALDGMDGPDAGDGECPEARRCGASCCDADERCWDAATATCIPDNGTCLDDDACINDTYCDGGVCVPYGVGDRGELNPDCRTEPEPLDHFTPDIQCEWPRPDEVDLVEPGSIDVRVPPLIGSLSGHGVPNIVFTSWGRGFPALVRAIRGDDCSTVWTSSVDAGNGDQDLALADVDDDSRLEIFGRSSDGVPFCLDYQGNVLWRGHDGGGEDVAVEPGLGQVAVAVADVDGASPPEVIVGLSVFDAVTGLLKLRGPDIGAIDHSRGIVPAIADIDDDGHLEAMTGRVVLDLVDGTEEDWPDGGHGFTAVAEMDSARPGPEIVAVTPGRSQIRVHASDGTLVWSASVPGGGGGPPTVSDLDGDGRAEFATAGNSYLTAFDLDCSEAVPDPAFCEDPDDSDGIVWSQASQDYSSGVTGSSVFDFEGDGPVEIVYGDECWTRVYDGKTGHVKFSAPHMSQTGYEYPTIGDVDGDFYTEFVVIHEWSDEGCTNEDPLSPGTFRESGRDYQGITVYRDLDDRWSPSRPLWTQHAEHYSQRNNDGTVASPEPASWLDHNSYRQNFPTGTAMDEPDLTARDITAPECDVDMAVQPLGATVCNRGTLPVAAGVLVTFRLDAADGEAICTAATEEILHPGDCTEVECDWIDVPLDEPHDVWAVADDDGTGAGAVNECYEGNNLAVAENVRCPPMIL